MSDFNHETREKNGSPERKLKVFLSHVSEDEEKVRLLCDGLKSDGAAPWLDQVEMVGGQDWKSKILTALRSSDIVIACFSGKAIRKAGPFWQEVRWACEIADEQPEENIFFIPLRLEEVDIPQSLRRWIWIDYYKERGYQDLKKALNQRARVLGVAPLKLASEEKKALNHQSTTARQESGVDDMRTHVQFVNRQDLLAQARGLIQNIQNGDADPCNLIGYFGVAGIGKTALLKELYEFLKTLPITSFYMSDGREAANLSAMASFLTHDSPSPSVAFIDDLENIASNEFLALLHHCETFINKNLAGRMVFCASRNPDRILQLLPLTQRQIIEISNLNLNDTLGLLDQIIPKMEETTKNFLNDQGAGHPGLLGIFCRLLQKNAMNLADRKLFVQEALRELIADFYGDRRAESDLKQFLERICLLSLLDGFMPEVAMLLSRHVASVFQQPTIEFNGYIDFNGFQEICINNSVFSWKEKDYEFYEPVKALLRKYMRNYEPEFCGNIYAWLEDYYTEKYKHETGREKGRDLLKTAFYRHQQKPLTHESLTDFLAKKIHAFKPGEDYKAAQLIEEELGNGEIFHRLGITNAAQIHGNIVLPSEPAIKPNDLDKPDYLILRPQYLDSFRAFLRKNLRSQSAAWIFYQHDAAEENKEKGGIGKTMLISEYRKILREENEFRDNFYLVEPLIDFIETGNRTLITVWSTLAKSIGKLPGADFDAFFKYQISFLEGNNVLFYKLLLKEFEKNIQNISAILDKKFVFVFDTFEFVQKQIEQVERSVAFPIPEIKGHSLVIISSRQKPDPQSENWKNRDAELDIVPIGGFTNDEAISLFKNSGIDPDSPTVTVINHDDIRKLNDDHHTRGRPILLALAIDYIKNRVVDIKDMLTIMGQNFHEKFVTHLNNFNNPLDYIIRLMAHIYSPWDFAMIEKFLSRRYDHPDTKKVFAQLSRLSFIRKVGEYRKAGEYALVLHDEMRELIIQYVWNKVDKNYHEREEISKIAAEYYDRLAASLNVASSAVSMSSPDEVAARQRYRLLKAEAWYHKLLYDFDHGFLYFLYSEFNQALDIGDLEQAEIYLNMLLELNKRRPLAETDWNRVLMRQLRVYLGRYYIEEAKKLGERLKKNLKKQLKKVKQGEIIQLSDPGGKQLLDEAKIRKGLGNIMHYLGQAYFLRANHRGAGKLLFIADMHYQYILTKDPDDYETKFLVGRNINWQGLNEMRQGHFTKALKLFTEAKSCLQNALTLLQEKKMHYGENDRDLQVLNTLEIEFRQWIAQVYGNMCEAHLTTEDLLRAEESGIAALQVRKQIGRPLEMLRSRNSLGLVYEKLNQFDRALQIYAEATEKMLGVQEPLLRGRIHTNLGTTLIRREAFSPSFFFSSFDTLNLEIERLEKVCHPEYEKGFKNLEEAMRILQELGLPSFERANACFNIGEYFMIRQNWHTAQKYLEDSIQVAKASRSNYVIFDAYQRLLAVHYYSALDAPSFRQILGEIDEYSSGQQVHDIKQYPNLLMRSLLLQGNFLIDAKLKGRDLPLPNVSPDEAFLRAFHCYYEAAKAIFHRSRTQFYKIIELIETEQRDRLPKNIYSELIKNILEWAEADRNDSEFYNDLRIHFTFKST